MLSFGQGSLRRAVLRRPWPAASSRWLSATSLPVCTGVPAGQLLCHGAPASNKPHPAEKSTPVWLAIWRTWAGFANSQLLPDAAALSSMQGLPRSGNSSAQTSASLHPPAALRLRVLPFTRTWSSTVCAEEFPTPLEMSLHGLPLLRHSKSVGPSAPIAYATSVSPPNEAVAWPGRRYPMGDKAKPGLVRRSCKSPRARILVLGTSGAHWPARWPRFELTERVAKS